VQSLGAQPLVLGEFVGFVGPIPRLVQRDVPRDDVIGVRIPGSDADVADTLGRWARGAP